MVALFQKLINDSSINIGDGTAGGITVAALLEILPHVSVGLSILWVILRIIVTLRDDFFLRKQKDGNQ
jgi:hypothetical protein